MCADKVIGKAVRDSAVERQVNDGRVKSALVENRTRRGFRCKWTKDIAALFVEEFVHCTIGGRIRTNDQQTTSSKISAHCCTIAALFAEYGDNDRISCLPHTLNLSNDPPLLRATAPSCTGRNPSR